MATSRTSPTRRGRNERASTVRQDISRILGGREPDRGPRSSAPWFHRIHVGPCDHCSMSDSPPPDQLLDESEQTYCYGHPDVPTRLRCSRCDRPICGRCAIPASVGQHCPECVAEARRSRPKVRTALAATAPAVLVLLVTNVVVYIGQQLLGFDAVTGRFAQVPGAIVDGEWYRLVTAMFLHAPNFVLHLLFNMYVLYVYGPYVEQ